MYNGIFSKVHLNYHHSNQYRINIHLKELINEILWNHRKDNELDHHYCKFYFKIII